MRILKNSPTKRLASSWFKSWGPRLTLSLRGYYIRYSYLHKGPGLMRRSTTWRQKFKLKWPSNQAMVLTHCGFLKSRRCPAHSYLDNEEERGCWLAFDFTGRACTE